MADKTYEGRLSCDGEGNLLAYEARQVGVKEVVIHDSDGEPVLDEEGHEVTISVPVMKFGKNHGKPVYHDTETDTYVFVKPGEPSHNERHHKTVLEITGTHTDPDFTDHPGYAGSEDEPAEGREHHWGPTPDDPHYSEGATNELGRVTNTKVKVDPDKVAAVISGHTSQHREKV